MAIVIYFCEVKSCTRQAEKMFETTGGKLYVCEAHSFASFRSPQYHRWISLLNQHRMPIQFPNHAPFERDEVLENLHPAKIGRNLKLLIPS